MADKKITDLQLRDDVDADVNFPVDDGIQTYRVTAPQVRLFTSLRPVLNKAADYVLAAADFVINVNASGGPRTMTLPDATANTGKVYKIKKVDESSNEVIITGTGGDLIDGEAEQIILAPFTSVEVISDGTNWFLN